MMNNPLSPEDLILVVVLPTPRDLEIARLLGWYRIPLRFAPQIISVDYLAFYQTSAFGPQHRWQVEYFASVRGHELTTRAELLRDETNHPRANEEYYKILLGTLQPLSKPIIAGKWKRFTFFYTNGHSLMKASTLKDLPVKSEERSSFWRTLRERALRAGSYTASELPEFPLEDALAAFLSAGISIHEDRAWYDSE